MSRHLILAQSSVTAGALNAWLQLLGEPPMDRADSRWIVRPRAADGASAVEVYESLVRAIEIALSTDAESALPEHAVVLVDSVRPSALSAIEEGSSWDNLVAMLILTFPEIHWVFAVTVGEAQDSSWSQRIRPITPCPRC